MLFIFVILEEEFCFQINCTLWLPDQQFHFLKTACFEDYNLGQVGQGFEQPDLVKDVPAHSRGGGIGDL